MSIPALLLGFVISTLFGALFHLFRGGGPGRLLLYLTLSWIGFWAGHALAGYFGWKFDSLGQLHLGTAALGALTFLFIGHWLSLLEGDKQEDEG